MTAKKVGTYRLPPNGTTVMGTVTRGHHHATTGLHAEATWIAYSDEDRKWLKARAAKEAGSWSVKTGERSYTVVGPRDFLPDPDSGLRTS